MKRVLLIAVCIMMLVQLCPFSALATNEEVFFAEAPSFGRRSPKTKSPSFDTEQLKDVLYAGLIECSTSIDISSFNIPPTEENIDIIADLMYVYIPESFHLKNSYSYSAYPTKISAICPQYRYSLSEYKAMLSEMVAVKEDLVKNIKGNNQLDDVQKALLLHDRLAMICQYDYTYSDIGATAYGAMVNGSAVCQGYAESYYYLLDDIGVKVDYCDSEQLNHIWNFVYINNVPYHVDVTWDDIAWGNGQRGAEGAVNHDNFLRSTSGIVSTGHNGTDYDTTPNSSVYDNYFWQNSSTEFQLIGNEIYYIDNVSETLERYSDNQALISVDSKWGYWSGSYARLSSDGKHLFYSLSDAVYQYNVSSQKSSLIFKPTLSTGENIYGFVYENGYLICDISDAVPYYTGREVLYQIKQSYTAPTLGTLKKWNISLDGNINLNYYISVDQSIASSVKVQITIAEETVSKRLSAYSVVGGLYKIGVELAAAQLNDMVTIQLVNGTDSDTIIVSSAREYCDKILLDQSQSAYHPLIKEMLNYGAMAQKYFSYNTSYLSNIGISGTGLTAVPTSSNMLSLSGNMSGCSFFGASLVFDSCIAVRFYFTGNVSGVTFKVNGNTYNPVLKNGMYYIEVSDILPQNLDAQISLIATNTRGQSISVSYGPMNYIVRMNQSGNANTRNLMKALYNYHLAAKALF